MTRKTPKKDPMLILEEHGFKVLKPMNQEAISVWVPMGYVTFIRPYTLERLRTALDGLRVQMLEKFRKVERELGGGYKVSELTQCNYCSLKYYRLQAKSKKYRVSLRGSSFMNGIDVFIHPLSVKIPANHVHVPDSKKGPDKYWCAWFGGLSKKCVC